MKTHVEFPSKKEIKKAAEILKKGGIVVFPTDTVYGVGCLYDNKESIEKIYKIKSRPKIPLPVLIYSEEQIISLGCELSSQAKDLINKFWPGALTLVVFCKSEKIGIRMPNYKPLLDLIKLSKKPLIGTSANFHGQPPVSKWQDLNSDFIKLVDFVIKGDCLIGQESTVVDCTNKDIEILRQGAVKIK